MQRHFGRCQCGNVEIKLELPKAAKHYTPRKCDCDFCTGYNCAYLSDPKGRINIQTKSPLLRKQHGSEQAEFLICSECDTLIAAVYSKASSLIGAINYNLLDAKDWFNPPQCASPKLLAAGEKLDRWKTLWMNISLKELD